VKAALRRAAMKTPVETSSSATQEALTKLELGG
jgi:hypothetical protein